MTVLNDVLLAHARRELQAKGIKKEAAGRRLCQYAYWPMNIWVNNMPYWLPLTAPIPT